MSDGYKRPVKEFRDYVYRRVKDVNPKLKKEEINLVISEVFESMKDFFLENQELKIPCFGQFSVHRSKAKKGRNPISGDTVIVPPHGKVKFMPSKLLKDDVWYLKE